MIGNLAANPKNMKEPPFNRKSVWLHVDKFPTSDVEA